MYSLPQRLTCVLVVIMVAMVAGGWNPASDPDANKLFSSRSVDEIRQIEQKTRYLPHCIIRF